MLISEFLPCNNLVPLLEEGDLIEFRRTMFVAGLETDIYQHWGLFFGFEDGEPKVIHIAGAGEDFAKITGVPQQKCSGFLSSLSGGSSAEVRSDSLNGVFGESLARINNSLDETHRPFPNSIVVKRAMYELGRKDYNIIFNNCEHFVKWCRYGIRTSNQAVTVKSIILSTVLAVGMNPILAVGIGSLFAATSNIASRTFSRTYGSRNPFSFF